MNNRIKTECARIDCLRMLILIIASVSFLSFSEVRLFLWSSVFWVKGEKEKKEKRKENKDGQGIPNFTGAFTVCLSLDTNDEYGTRREELKMFPLSVIGMKVLSSSHFSRT